MTQKIKNYILAAITLLTLVTPALVPAMAAASTCGDIRDGANGALGPGSNVDCNKQGVDTDTISTIAGPIVNVLSIIVGIAAVIMIIYGGLRYVTSGGDSGNVGNAKNILIYAIVGLVIVALAQLIVHFVLATTTNSTEPCQYNPKLLASSKDCIKP